MIILITEVYYIKMVRVVFKEPVRPLTSGNAQFILDVDVLSNQEIPAQRARGALERRPDRNE